MRVLRLHRRGWRAAAHFREIFLPAADHVTHIGTYRDPEKALLDEFARHVRIHADDTRWLTQPLACLRAFLELVLYRGVADVADEAHRGGQISRTDENRIDAGNGGDRLKLIERRNGFDLHDHANLFVCALEVIRYRAVAAAAMRPGDAAHAVRRIAGRCDRALRFVHILHEGKKQ